MSNGVIVFDVIIPVYNALAQTCRCVESVLVNSSLPYRLILVNDCSDEQTTFFLRTVAEQHRERIALLENEKNLGFLDSANRGLRYLLDDPAAAQIKILLNSDTIVSRGWLEAFQRCFSADARIGIATPLSTNAEYLSVKMPQGFNIIDSAEIIAGTEYTERYAEITTAVGFCMAIRSSLCREIGLFDEIFAPGYGEESDFHFRAISRGYRSVVVADCFIYHESHASFSEKKLQLVARNRPTFDQRWSTIYLNELKHNMEIRPVEEAKQALAAAGRKGKKHDVLFVVGTAKLFGGIVVVYEICNRLIQRGIDANVIVLTEPQPIDMELYFSPYFRPDRSWPAEIPEATTYVATHFATVPYAFAAHAKFPEAKLAYLVQGYEGWFPGALLEKVVATYEAIPNRIVVSGWLQTMLGRWNYDSTVLANGVDTRFFYPAKDQLQAGAAGEPLRILIQVRDDPQGGFRQAFDILREIKELIPQTYITVVGDLCNHAQVVPYSDERIPHADRKGMRAIYQRHDVFIDCSMVQGFGLMGLEAMACGLVTVLAETGGITEYATRDNSLLCPLGSRTAIVDAIRTLHNDRTKLLELKHAGVETASRHDWEAAADLYKRYFTDLAVQGTNLSAENYRAISRCYFYDLRAAQMRTEILKRIDPLLSAELQSHAPRGAYEIAGALHDCELMEVLQSTYEGMLLVKIYEQARAVTTGAHAARPLFAPAAPGSLLAQAQQLVGISN